jgi:quinol monooxygenase YgiN
MPIFGVQIIYGIIYIKKIIMKKSIKTGVLFCIFCSLLCLSSCNCHSSDKKAADEKGACCKKAADEKGACCKKAADENSLTIVANVTVQAEYKDELLKAFEKVVDATRKESGNISYDLYEDTSNPLRFTFVETWESQSAIESHNSSAHFLEFASAIEGKAGLDVSTLKQKF